MYHFEFDVEKRLLHSAMSGYWSMDDFHIFYKDYFTELKRLAQKYGRFRALTDLRDFPVQSMEVTEAFSRITPDTLALNTGPWAMVMGSNIGKMQVKRAVKGAKIGIFNNYEDAMAWLFAEQLDD